MLVVKTQFLDLLGPIHSGSEFTSVMLPSVFLFVSVG